MGENLAVQVLLDTHAFLWWIADSDRLSGRAHSVIEDELNNILVSAASVWEIATKLRIGKLPGWEGLVPEISGHISRQGFRELEITVKDAEHAGFMQAPHRDPFDRMLAAQALLRGCPMISVDPALDSFGVRRLW